MRRLVVLLKNFFVEDIHLKLTSIVLAVLLWMAINGEPQSVVLFKVPLEYRNYPKGVEVVGDSVQSVDVRLAASSSAVRRLEPSDITAFVDLSDWSLGSRTYSLSERNVRVPMGIKLIRISPSQIRLHFERFCEKMVEIRPKITGTVTRGYRIRSVVCIPPLAGIAGPQSRVASIANVNTEAIDISGRSGSLLTQVRVDLDDPLVRLVKDQQVTVKVLIEPSAP